MYLSRYVKLEVPSLQAHILCFCRRVIKSVEAEDITCNHNSESHNQEKVRIPVINHVE